jgi:hypothetical protein
MAPILLEATASASHDGGLSTSDVIAFASLVVAVIAGIVGIWAIMKTYDAIKVARRANTIAERGQAVQDAQRELTLYVAVQSALQQLRIAAIAGAAEVGRKDFLDAKRALAAGLVPVASSKLPVCRKLTADATQPDMAQAAMGSAQQEVEDEIKRTHSLLAPQRG